MQVSSIPELLTRFQGFREELKDSAFQQQEIAKVLGASVPQLREILETSADLAKEPGVNMVLLGEEGAGKSTFASLMLGSECTPQSREDPGTVAPVYLEFGEDAAPVYNVQVQQDRELVTKKAVKWEEFRDYLLQGPKHNFQNKKNVRAGIVQLRHPLLAHGLRLADMPGIGGVDKEIAKDALKFIDSQGHIIIGIVKDRQYSQLLDQLWRFGLTGDCFENNKTDRKLAGVLINLWASDFDEPPKDIPAEEWVHKQMEIWREAAAHHLRIEANVCFVLDFKRLKKNKDVTDREQTEFRNLCDHIWNFCDHNGVYGSLNSAVKRVEQAGKVLQDCLDTRRAYLDGLKNYPDLRQQIKAEFPSLQSQAIAKWQDESTKDGGEFERAVWDTLSEAVNEVIATTRAALSSVHVKLTKQCRDRKLGKEDMERHIRTLQSTYLSMLRDISKIESKNTKTFESHYSAFAQAALDWIYTTLQFTTPGLNPPNIDFASRVAPGSLVLDYEQELDWKTLGLTTGGAAIGGAMAFKSSSSVPVRVAGALFGALVGFGIDHFARDPNKEKVETKMAEVEKSIAEYEAQFTEGGQKNWERQVERLKRNIGKNLTDTVAELGRLLGVGGSFSSELVEDELKRIEASRDKKSLLDRRLKDLFERVEEMKIVYQSQLKGLH